MKCNRQCLLALGAAGCGIVSFLPKGDVAQEAWSAEVMDPRVVAPEALSAGVSADEIRAWGRRVDRDIAHHPLDAAARNERGELFWTLGQRENALREWQKAERLDPSNGAVLNHLGNAALDAAQISAAADYYERAVRAAPHAAVYHYNLANLLYLFRGDLAQGRGSSEESLARSALVHYAEAARLSPQSSLYWSSYGETFFLLAKPDWHAALSAWEHYLSLADRKDFALSNLARIHLHLGDKDAARECLAKMDNPAFGPVKANISRQIEQE